MGGWTHLPCDGIPTTSCSKKVDELFCDGCIKLYLTEEKQDLLNKQKDPHLCMEYKEQVIHGLFHPRIMRLDKCIKENKKVI
jgi:hypothetical protein